jgi:hypothetical protein
MITQESYSFATEARHLISRTDGGSDGYTVIISNNLAHDHIIYIGDSTVTDTTGSPVAKATTITLRLGESEKLYAYCANTGASLNILYIDLKGAN